MPEEPEADRLGSKRHSLRARRSRSVGMGSMCGRRRLVVMDPIENTAKVFAVGTVRSDAGSLF
jgi:hypothetical protein